MIQAVEWALSGLAVSAFTSATILPGNSELALLAFLHKWPERLWLALCIVSVANTLGSLTSVWLGRIAPAKPLSPRLTLWFNRFGPAVLLLAWVPFIGDALPLAAGWLRLRWLPCVIWLTVGKTARYLVLAWGMLSFASLF